MPAAPHHLPRSSCCASCSSSTSDLRPNSLRNPCTPATAPSMTLPAAVEWHDNLQPSAGIRPSRFRGNSGFHGNESPIQCMTNSNDRRPSLRGLFVVLAARGRQPLLRPPCLQSSNMLMLTPGGIFQVWLKVTVLAQHLGAVRNCMFNTCEQLQLGATRLVKHEPRKAGDWTAKEQAVCDELRRCAHFHCAGHKSSL